MKLAKNVEAVDPTKGGNSIIFKDCIIGIRYGRYEIPSERNR